MFANSPKNVAFSFNFRCWFLPSERQRAKQVSAAHLSLLKIVVLHLSCSHDEKIEIENKKTDKKGERKILNRKRKIRFK